MTCHAVNLALGAVVSTVLVTAMLSAPTVAHAGAASPPPGPAAPWQDGAAPPLGPAAPQPGGAAAPAPAAAPRQDEPPAAPARNEIDRLVQDAFAGRHAGDWRRLGDFLLRETLAVAVEARPGSPLAGFRRTREYEWYVREGWAVRSPVSVDGVAVGEARRRRYERDWRRGEQRRRASLDTSGADPEPRFVTDFHYFLEWDLAPGDCYFADRERAAGRDAVRLECYPTGRLQGKAGNRIDRGIRKTSMLTLWVDPGVRRIVKYSFENSGLEFLPFRWLVRADGFLATLEMAPAGGVWMPARMHLAARLATARGELEVEVTQRFFEYREAETGARLVDPARAR